MPGFSVLALLMACCLTSELAAQAPAAQRIPLLDHLIGKWKMSGTVLGKPATYRLDARWVLQRRFMELHMEDVAHTPPGYEARVFIGPDTLSGHVLAHWMDNTGAAYSVPPATGAALADTLTLDFPYPTGDFHDTFVYDHAKGSWQIRLDAADGAGGWKRFAEYRVIRR